MSESPTVDYGQLPKVVYVIRGQLGGRVVGEDVGGERRTFRRRILHDWSGWYRAWLRMMVVVVLSLGTAMAVAELLAWMWGLSILGVTLPNRNVTTLQVLLWAGVVFVAVWPLLAVWERSFAGWSYVGPEGRRFDVRLKRTGKVFNTGEVVDETGAVLAGLFWSDLAGSKPGPLRVVRLSDGRVMMFRRRKSTSVNLMAAAVRVSEYHFLGEAAAIARREHWLLQDRMNLSVTASGMQEVDERVWVALAGLWPRG